MLRYIGMQKLSATFLMFKCCQIYGTFGRDQDKKSESRELSRALKQLTNRRMYFYYSFLLMQYNIFFFNS